MMRRILLFILAIILLPFYPIFKKAMKTGEKVRISERVVVVTIKEGRKRCIF